LNANRAPQLKASVRWFLDTQELAISYRLFTMTKEQTNSVGFCIAGLLLLLTNKPFGELCRQWQIIIFSRDYGILSFRVPIIIIGTLLLLIGIGFVFF
jgi:hypothetical protein